MKITITNLSHRMTKPDLKQLFTQYGQVSTIKLFADTDNVKRIMTALVEMPVNDQAEMAIRGLKGREFFGLKIELAVSVADT